MLGVVGNHNHLSNNKYICEQRSSLPYGSLVDSVVEEVSIGGVSRLRGRWSSALWIVTKKSIRIGAEICSRRIAGWGLSLELAIAGGLVDYE